MAARPAVIPETFSGDGSFPDWVDHFEAVAEVNAWDDAAKALWLRVRLVGRAQNAFKAMSNEDRADYSRAKKKLLERFEPDSKCALYEAEFQCRRKRPSEDWASFGEDMKMLATKAFPDLNEAATERLAVSNYLGQLDPQIAFSVRQRKPKTITEAVTATLEMESYRLAPSNSINAPQPSSEPSFVDAVQQPKRNAVQPVVDMMQRLMDRMDKLETQMHRRNDTQRRRNTSDSGEADATKPPVVCRRCGIEGHYARGCAAPRPRQSQGND